MSVKHIGNSSRYVHVHADPGSSSLAVHDGSGGDHIHQCGSQSSVKSASSVSVLLLHLQLAHHFPRGCRQHLHLITTRSAQYASAECLLKSIYCRVNWSGRFIYECVDLQGESLNLTKDFALHLPYLKPGQIQDCPPSLSWSVLLNLTTLTPSLILQIPKHSEGQVHSWRVFERWP